MHIPDGFLDGPTTIGTDAVAVVAVAACLRIARAELAERPAPLAGLVAAFVFAVQLASVPLAAGTSAHLLGGVLAAVLVGPATAVLSSVVVLGVQSLLLGYGGVTALGASALVMDIVPIAVGYALFLAARAVLPRVPSSTVVAAAVAAGVAAPAGAATFALLYAVGGTTGLDPGTVAAVVIGAHLVVGATEAAVTAVAVRSLLAVRPDLVRAAHAQATVPAPAPAPAPRRAA
jgi:cobalt/nickel transport system permease protein